ncbi:hypothetical protein BGX33_011235 [Mortierella sp. NVP41]|nr:hypothetical protein BGX33_011235 [Mortierella sp. NVP41]
MVSLGQSRSLASAETMSLFQARLVAFYRKVGALTRLTFLDLKVAPNDHRRHFDTNPPVGVYEMDYEYGDDEVGDGGDGFSIDDWGTDADYDNPPGPTYYDNQSPGLLVLGDRQSGRVGHLYLLKNLRNLQTLHDSIRVHTTTGMKVGSG